MKTALKMVGALLALIVLQGCSSLGRFAKAGAALTGNPALASILAPTTPTQDEVAYMQSLGYAQRNTPKYLGVPCDASAISYSSAWEKEVVGEAAINAILAAPVAPAPVAPAPAVPTDEQVAEELGGLLSGTSAKKAK